MSTNESKNTTGELIATGTSIRGFSTKDVSFRENLSDKGYSFDGKMDEETLNFFMRTLNVKEKVIYEISQYWSGEKDTAAAHYTDADGTVYNGVSGTIEFSKFDTLSQEAVFEAHLSMKSSGGGIKEKVTVKGNFFGFDSHNL